MKHSLGCTSSYKWILYTIVSYMFFSHQTTQGKEQSNLPFSRMAVAHVRLARGVAPWSEIVKAVMGMDGGPNDDTKRGETRPPTLREKYCV